MKKFVICFLILAGFVPAAVIFLPQRAEGQRQQIAQQSEATDTPQDVVDFPEPPPGAIVFDMKYRGLSGGKDELCYNTAWAHHGKVMQLSSTILRQESRSLWLYGIRT